MTALCPISKIAKRAKSQYHSTLLYMTWTMAVMFYSLTWYLDDGGVILFVDMEPAPLALHCPGQQDTVPRQLSNNHYYKYDIC